MFESGKTTPVIKKSYEIAYALCRIAEKIPEKSFADALANEGVKLLGFAAEGEYGRAVHMLAAVEYFIKLGTGIGFVDFANGEVLLAEIASLDGIIAGLLNSPKIQSVDLSGIFTSVEKSVPVVIPETALVSPKHSSERGSTIQGPAVYIQSVVQKDTPIIQESGRLSSSLPHSNNPAINSGNPAIVKDESGNENSPEILELIKSGDRQGAILEKIRQSGNCRIRDIHDLFPECSERTLRYDLQSLTEQNLIEKVGIGGPGVFYKNRG